jgi:hypothetical protein
VDAQCLKDLEKLYKSTLRMMKEDGSGTGCLSLKDSIQAFEISRKHPVPCTRVSHLSPSTNGPGHKAGRSSLFLREECVRSLQVARKA